MRILIILVGAVAVAGAALSGLWWYNSSVAREQIELALAELGEMGVDAQYASLDITGFPTAYHGEFVDLVAQVNDRGLRLEFPEASAGMSLSSIGTVTFVLPDRFTITYLDQDGEPLGAPLEIVSDRLIGDVTPGSGQDYAFSISADALSIAPVDDPTNIDSVSLTEARWTGSLEVDGEQGGLDIESVFDAAAVSATFLSDTADAGGDMPEVAFSAGGLRGEVDGVPTSLDVSVTADTFDVDGGSFFTVGIEDFAFTIEARPDQPLQLAELLELDSPNQMAAQFLQVAAFGILEGGSFDQDITFGALRMSGEITDLPPDAPFDRFSLEATDIGYGVDVDRELMAVAFEGDRLAVDVDGDEPQSFSFDNFEVAARAIAGPDGFELTPLATPDPLRSLGERLAFLIRDEIVDGGQVEVAVEASGSESSVFVGDAAPIPFTFGTAGESSRTTIVIEADAARIDSDGETRSYALGFGLQDYGVDLESLTIDGSFPLPADTAPQTATLRLALGPIALDDALAAFFRDPSGALVQDIPGASIDIDFVSVVRESLLEVRAPTPSANLIEPRTLIVNEALIELFGLRVLGAGAVDLQGAPSGQIDVTVSNWSDVFAGLQSAPVASLPGVGPVLTEADAFLQEFGVQGAGEDDIRLAVRLESTGQVLINGREFPPQ